MRFKKNIKKLFFKLTVKSPFTVVVIIAIVTASLLNISMTNYSSVYVKAQGSFYYSNNNSYITVNFNEKYKGNINKTSPVIFYFTDNDKRYDGRIIKINEVEKPAEFNIRIEPVKKVVNLTKNKDVIVEVQIKKVRIIEKLTMKEDSN